jgi:DNA-binding XRE family transcriptional regulator
VSLIGNEIKRHRLRANMTSKTLAGCTALSEQDIGDIQHGRRLPSVETLLVICNVFPDADPGRWLWLMLRDQWGDGVFEVMWRYAGQDWRRPATAADGSE